MSFQKNQFKLFVLYEKTRNWKVAADVIFVLLMFFNRASFAKHLRSRKHLESIQQEEMIIPDWLIQEPKENLKENTQNNI